MILKKCLVALMLLACIFSVAACGNSNTEVLNVYNWGEYIDEDVLTQFEKEYDCKVNYENYASNEEMFVKLQNSGSSYDVVFPSDYMIEKMINEDMLSKINMSNIPNLSNVDDRFTGMEFDTQGNHYVPYFWGTLGILYDKTIVTDPVDSWDILWNEKYKKQILMYDSQRDSLAVALLKLGYSINTRDEKQLEEAKDELIEQKPLVLSYVGDQVIDMMISGEAAMAVVYSGDAVYCMEENENLNYVIPKEGSNIWVDGMVIPKTSQNKELAEKFINFMCDPEIAKMNTEYVGYATTNKTTMDMIKDEDWTKHMAYSPSQDILDKCELFRDPGEYVELYGKVWTEFKAEK